MVELIKALSEYTDIYLDRALVAFRNGEFNKAKGYLEEGVKHNPQAPLLWAWLRECVFDGRGA